MMAREGIRLKAKSIFVALVLWSLPTCSNITEPDGQFPPAERTAEFLRVSVLEEAAPASGIVSLKLENLSNLEIDYNLCIDRRIERWNENRWADVKVDVDGVCPAVALILPPGSEATHITAVPAELSPGIYRFDFGSVLFASQGPESLPQDDRKTNSFMVTSSSP
ncbi:MAG: hypothetical protein ACREMD_02625 [Gemmatimonadota bacterium]